MSNLITIEAAPRTGTGKGYNNKLRATGKVPANILDASKSTLIELEAKNLSKAWLSGKQFTLKFNNTERVVMMKELQIDPVKRTVRHLDLMYV